MLHADLRCCVVRAGGDRDGLAARPGDGGLDGAAGDHGGHRAAVVGRGPDVGDRRRRGRRGLRRGLGGLAPAVGADERLLCGLGTRRIVGASAVIAILAVVDAIPPSRVTTAAAPDDGDLHLPPVLEPDVGAAASPPAGGGRSTATQQLVRRGGRLARAPRRARRRRARAAAARSTSVDRRASKQMSGRAGVHRRRGVHDVAADRALRARRVRADDGATASASAVKRSRTTGWPTSSRVRDERAEPQPAAASLSDAAQLVDAVDGDERVRQRRLALAGADDEVGAARRPGARRARERADGLLDGRRGDVRRASSSPSSCDARPDALGRHRQLRDVPVRSTLAMALPIAPAVGTQGGSPTPFEPFGPGVRRLDLDPARSRSPARPRPSTSL